jgi:hypothetical protein
LDADNQRVTLNKSALAEIAVRDQQVAVSRRDVIGDARGVPDWKPRAPRVNGMCLAAEP